MGRAINFLRRLFGRAEDDRDSSWSPQKPGHYLYATGGICGTVILAVLSTGSLVQMTVGLCLHWRRSPAQGLSSA